MRLLALIESPDHVCYRYRVQAFEGALRRAGVSIIAEPIESSLFGRLRQFHRAREFDAVLVQRKLLPGWQLRLLRRSAARLIFDFDDAVLYRDSYSPKGPNSVLRARRFAAVVGAADAVVAGNSFLVDCARRAGAPADRIRRIPTCINLEDYPDHEDRPPQGSGDLVWIGSSSTLHGLERERSLWERLGKEIPGLAMRVVCDRFPEFQGVAIVKILWRRETEARELAQGGIGVGLLPDDPWSRGKCGLKILQYQAAGLPVVANPVGAHREMIRPGFDGFLASTPDEWIAAIRSLRDDEPARRSMGAAARLNVESNYSTNVWAGAFVEAVTGNVRRGLDASDVPLGRRRARTGSPTTSTK